MESGEIIGERYRLHRKIGEGGTGRIWLARDERLDRRVAIKFLYATTPEQQARYAKRVELEAKIAASIQHRNVVQIFDYGTHEDNVPYIVMEALTGFTLGAAFDSTQSFGVEVLVQLITDVLRGLSAVHDAGIVHRDLKPENIFLVKERGGKLLPKLLDFGISRSLEPEMRASAVTTTEGMILGTPQYMSPEQARGVVHIDKRTDIYSAGTIMFEAFAGVVPFPARNAADVLIAVLHEPAPPLYDYAPQIGWALCAVVDKALSKDRKARYAHAAEMLDAVLAAANEIPGTLDRQVPLYPPDAIRSRTPKRQPAADGGEAEGLHVPAPKRDLTPPTLEEPSAQRRIRRSRAPSPEERREASQPMLPLSAAPASPAPAPASASAPRTLWIALAVVSVFGVSIAAAVTLLSRQREPEGSGLIVVQAPTPSLAATQPAPASPSQPSNVAAAEASLEVALDDRDRSEAKSRKSAASASAKARKNALADPLQLMASGVADAFSRQKASVIGCLNEHAGDLEGAPQLQVRLEVDARGTAREAQLLPQSISNKPVARCIEAAVTHMSFPAPPQPTTFRVPLLWRRK